MPVSDGMLELQSIEKTYVTGEVTARVLRGVNLTAGSGETLALIGPSGSGKSTLLHIVGSLDKPTSGRVSLDGRIITELQGSTLAKFRAMDVGFVFQDHHLLPQLTALENVLLPVLALGDTDQGQERAWRLLERVGITERAAAFPAHMSGGERQRTAIARAMINAPRLLLCDEPSGNLDRETAAPIIALFLELAEEEDVTVIMATHNLAHAREFSRCLRLRDGVLVEIDEAGIDEIGEPR